MPRLVLWPIAACVASIAPRIRAPTEAPRSAIEGAADFRAAAKIVDGPSVAGGIDMNIAGLRRFEFVEARADECGGDFRLDRIQIAASLGSCRPPAHRRVRERLSPQYSLGHPLAGRAMPACCWPRGRRGVPPRPAQCRRQRNRRPTASAAASASALTSASGTVATGRPPCLTLVIHLSAWRTIAATTRPFSTSNLHVPEPVAFDADESLKIIDARDNIG